MKPICSVENSGLEIKGGVETLLQPLQPLKNRELAWSKPINLVATKVATIATHCILPNTLKTTFREPIHRLQQDATDAITDAIANIEGREYRAVKITRMQRMQCSFYNLTK